MTRWLSLLYVVSLIGCASGPQPGPGPAPLPFKPGDPVDIALFGVVKTWKGPLKQYPRKVRLQESIELDPLPHGGWLALADVSGDAPNIGVEWDEQRFFERVVIRFHSGAVPPLPSDVQLQVWGAVSVGKPDAVTESPHAGVWVAVDAKPERVGRTWTWHVPPIARGTYKVRAVLKKSPMLAVSAFAIYGTSTWRNLEIAVRSSYRNIEIHNGILNKTRAVSGGRVNGDWTALNLMTADVRGSTSPDRTIVTMRGENGGCSFLVDDLVRHGRLGNPYADTEAVVPPPDVQPSAQDGQRFPTARTVRRRVAEMPEQTYEHALRNVPPKTRNKWLALAPGSNVNKFVVLPDGNVFARRDAALHVEFATGAEPNFTRREPQRVEDDCLPILIAEWDDGPIHWKQEYCCVPLAADRPETEWRGDETTVLSTRVTATNASPDVSATARAHIRFVRDGKPVKTALGEGLLTIEDKGAFGYLDASEAVPRLDDSTIAVPLALDPGASRAVTLHIAGPGSDWANIYPDARLRRLFFDAARRWTLDYWSGRLAACAKFTVPEEKLNRLWKSLLIHQSMWGDQDPKRGWLPNVAAFAYGPVGNESSQMIKALDMYGDPAQARRYLDPMVTMQGANNLNARVESGEGALIGYWAHYTFNTGFILWNAADHYRFTRDRAWLSSHAPHLVKACDWIAQERRATMKTDARGRKVLGYGFFPPCGLEDLPVWQYWTMTNAYLAGGMRHAAEVLADIGHPDAARLAEEARAYRDDVAAGVHEAMTRCPVMPLLDGTWVPYIPKHIHQRGRPSGPKDLGDYEAELGALHLATMDIFPPDSPEIDATLDFHEDQVYLTEAPNDGSILSLSTLRENWFNLGGYGKTQPYLVHTAVTYIRRDEPKHALRSFYNNLVAQNWHDINAFPEHISRHGAADCKTYEEAMALQQFRTLLLHEERGELWIAPAASRHWFADGKEIAVERAPTFFGPVSYTIRSETARGRIAATIRPPSRNPPEAVRLRFRHPAEKPMRRVIVNGTPIPAMEGAFGHDSAATTRDRKRKPAPTAFDAATEWIYLKDLSDPLEVTAEY